MLNSFAEIVEEHSQNVPMKAEIAQIPLTGNIKAEIPSLTGNGFTKEEFKQATSMKIPLAPITAPDHPIPLSSFKKYPLCNIYSLRNTTEVKNIKAKRLDIDFNAMNFDEDGALADFFNSTPSTTPETNYKSPAEVNNTQPLRDSAMYLPHNPKQEAKMTNGVISNKFKDAKAISSYDLNPEYIYIYIYMLENQNIQSSMRI